MRSFFSLEVFCGLVFLCLIASPAHAATLFVDGNAGDDQGGANACTSVSNPCATIQQAIDSAQAGDTIRIADAVYTKF